MSNNAIKFAARYKAETADLVLNGWEAYVADSAAPDWVKALRLRSAEKVRMMGLPTQKLERFKYTNIPAFLKINTLEFAAQQMSVDGATSYVKELHDSYNQDFVRDALEATPAGEDKYGDMMLWDAANSLVAKGLVVHVPKSVQETKTLNIRFKGEAGQASAPRLIIRLEDNVQFNITELHTGEGAYWHNGVTQIHVGKNARLVHYRLQENAHESLHTQNTHIVMEEGAHYECFTYTTGAKTSRHQVHVDMIGAHGEVHVNGLNLLEGKQLGDTTITVDHCAPNCNSNQNFRSVLNGQAIGVFQGKVHVHQIAQKTDGYQFAKSLLLSPLASMNTKPELEIYADDVKCSHGTTSGEIDEGALFYLRSRGLSQDMAEKLLIEAFIAEVLEDISDEDMQAHILHRAQEWLKGQKK